MRTLEIVHRTRYEYSAPVTLGEHRLMFRPRDSHDLRLLYTGLAIDPAAQVRWIHDAFGNSIAIAQFDGTTQLLELTSTIRLEHFGLPPELPPIEEYARKLPFAYLAEEAPDLARYVERHYPDPNSAVSSWAKQFVEGKDGTDTFAMLTRMCRGIQQTLTYAMRFEAGTQSPAVTLETGGGTCRDYALLMMEGARALGLAARFISGYLYDPALDDAAGGASSPRPSTRLDGGLSAGRGLGRVRSDQRHHRHGTVDPRRGGPRSRAGHADQGHLHRQRRRGGEHTGRRPGAHAGTGDGGRGGSPRTAPPPTAPAPAPITQS